MEVLQHLGVALGLATLAGVNLYLTVFLTGLAVRFDFLHLAAQHQNLEVLGHPVVLMVSGVLFLMEFFADKVPWVDSLWDSVHTFIRPVGGVLLGLQALGETPLYVQVAAALMAGGAALTTHTAKSGTRLAVNHSPEPVSNAVLSVAEDAAVAGGVVLTLMHPVVALGVFTGILIILWLLLPRLWRTAKTTLWLAWNKLKMPGRTTPPAEPLALRPVLDDSLQDQLRLHAGVDPASVVLTVECVSARGRGIRGLSPNLGGTLVVLPQAGYVYFRAIKGFRTRLFRVPVAEGGVSVDSRFLSENLVLEGPASRAVFRFHRGEAEVVQAVALRLRQLQEAPAAVPAAEVGPVMATQPEVASPPAVVDVPANEPEAPVRLADLTQPPAEVTSAKVEEVEVLPPAPDEGTPPKKLEAAKPEPGVLPFPAVT